MPARRAVISAWLLATAAFAQPPDYLEPPAVEVPPAFELPPPRPDAIASPLDSVLQPRSGWAAGVEIGLVTARDLYRNQDEYYDRQVGDFDLAVSPWFTLGYRFADPRNAVLMSYRNLGTERGFDDNPGRTDRLDINQFEANYVRTLTTPSERLRLDLTLGGRLLTAYHDTKSTYTYQSWDNYTGRSETRTSAHFVGAGPGIGVGSTYLWTPRFMTFASTDFAAVFGDNTWKYSYLSDVGPGENYGGGGEEKRSETIKILRAELGVGWSPFESGRSQIRIGFRFEYWWDFANYGSFSEDLAFHGPFAQWSVNY